ncbi:hypothetical protein ACX12E_15745 [Paenibacillus vandeheii]
MMPQGEEAIDPKPYVMLMSKVTETASIEAFDIAIKWTNPNTDGSDFMSNKIIHISNVYMTSAAPGFSDQVATYIRELVSGGTNVVEIAGRSSCVTR